MSALGARAQQRSAPVYFQEDAAAQRAAASSPLAAALRSSRPLTLNTASLQATLATAPLAGRAGASPVVLALPLPDGSTARFRVVEYPLMAPGLAAQLPQVKTYGGVGVDDPSATVQLDMTPRGFHAQILSDQSGTVYIDPVTRTDTQHYLSFARSAMPAAQLSCGVTEHVTTAARRSLGSGAPGTAQRTSGTTLRTYRLAVAATAEYTAFQGGAVPLAQAAIVTTVNRVRGVYEKELAVSFTLINNTQIIYTNASTDPYTNGNADAMIDQNQTNLDNVVLPANYDIGHVFGTNSGGLAGLGVVCVAGQKGSGVTGSGAPVGDSFDIDYVAHEFGHQFGANHSFNANTSSCVTRNAGTAYEPGSGTTIMAYAGICGAANDVQNNSDAYFHVVSYEEIQAYLATTSCGTTTAVANTPPSVTLPASGKVLPIGTPFKLTAVGSDADADALTYSWEEYDLGSGGSPTAAQTANNDVPLFRSFVPSSSGTRYFPRLSDLTASTTTLGERLPTVTRDLNFRVMVRDRYTSANTGTGVTGGVNSSAIVALRSTGAAGPFLVTAPNTAVTWTGNTSRTVTWSVAGTSANGVNCATVNILLSTDGGLTYPTVLLAGTPNNGTAAITVPSVATTTARIMVEAADNYFFDISNTNFTITAATTCAAPTGLSVGSITATTASLSFTASGSATSYTVTTSPATTTQTVTAAPVTLTGLLGGTSYTVFVQSSCAAGATSTTASTSFTTLAPPVCNAVTNAAVGSVTATTASLSFTASAGAGNYMITTSPATSTYTVTASPVSLTGLTAGTAYTVNIQTNCSNGGSATASTTFGTPPANDNCAGAVQLISGTSCTPTAGTVTGATQSQAASTCNGSTSSSALDVWYSFVATGAAHTVTLASPSFDGVVQVFSGTCGSLSSLGCRDQNSAGTETLNLTGLTANTRYYIRVYPYNTAPTDGSFTICVTGTVAPTCAAPTSLSAGSITNTSASISFTPNAQASSYTVTTSPATTTQSVTASPVSLTGLTPGTSYTVSIATNCQNGLTSTAATTTFATTNTSTCAAPTSLSAGNVASTSATVSFTASASATSYTVTYTPNGGSTQTVSPNPTGTSVNLTGLTPGTSYTVNVASNCAGGATSGAAQTFFFTYTVPVVTSVLIPNVTYLLGQNLPILVSFNQNLNVTGSPTLPVTIGSTVRQAALDAANTSGTDLAFTYTIQAGDLDTDGITLGTISLNGGTIRSLNGTDANLSLNNPNTSGVRVDGIRPTTLSSNRLTPLAALTNGTSVTFRVTFSEAVLGVDVSDFTIGNVGSVMGTIASVSGSGTTYDVVVNNLSGAGDFRLNMTAIGTAIRDVAGNGVGSSNTFFSGEFYTLDQAAPNTIIDSSPAATTTSTSAVFTFSGDDGSGSGVTSFQGSLDGAAFATASSPLTFTGLSTGQHTFQVRAVDAAGNVDPTPAAYTWTITAPIPAPALSSLNPTSGPAGTSVTITGTDLTGATAVSFNGTAAPGFTVNSAASITVTVPAGASTGNVTVTTPGGTSNGLPFTVTLPDLLVTTALAIPTGAYNNVTIAGTGTLTLNGALNVAGTMTVQNGGTLITNFNVVQGSGSFALEAGATIHVFNIAGLSAGGTTGSIRNTGTRSFSDDANYVYRGIQAQVTGAGLPATVRNLTINNPGGVTLSADLSIRQALTPAAGTFTTTGRVLTLLSTAGSTAYVAYTRPTAGSISGPITAQRYVDGSLNAGPGYRHFSAPVTNTSFADLAAGSFAPVVNAAYNSAAQPNLVVPYPTVFAYEQGRIASITNNLSGFDKGWASPAALSETMSSGQGYTVHAPAGITVDFVGTPGQTDLSKPNLGRGPGADAGWHLLGNPYPAPIHWDSLLAHGGLSGLENALYVFKSSGAYAGSYASYVNGIGANNGGPVLPLGQGFFVRTATVGGTGQLTFRNTDRLNTNLAPAFQRTAASARPLLRLAVSGPASAGTDETVVYFEPGATATGPDAAHDAPKLANPGARLSLASQLPGTEPLAINGLPLTGAPTTSIPLTLSVPAAGPYLFDVLDLAGFAANAPATLLDHQLNTRTNLRQGTSYAFTAAQAGALNGRFELLLGRPGSVTATAGAGGLQFSVWPNPASPKAPLHVQLAQAATATIILRDVLGRSVAQHSFSGLSTELSTAKLAAGTYLLTVQVPGQAPATRRVVVE